MPSFINLILDKRPENIQFSNPQTVELTRCNENYFWQEKLSEKLL